MRPRRLIVVVCSVCLAGLLIACGPLATPERVPPQVPLPTAVPPATPSSEAVRVSGTSPAGPRLRVTIPAIRLLQRPVASDAQVFAVLADPLGTYSYLLYPANRSGDAVDRFDLADYPLEISLEPTSERVYLWVLAVHHSRYAATEFFGVEALTASLGFGFRNWLEIGDPRDDPLAAVISASEGALYEWFASAQVLGQIVVPLDVTAVPDGEVTSHHSPDGGLSLVYSAQLIAAEAVAQLPGTTPTVPHPGYTLVADETFAGGKSGFVWFQGQDTTFINHLVDGAYEIRLTGIKQGASSLSWGSLEGQRFTDYLVEAQVRLVEAGVAEARYGIWFHYQDDYNFIYFGISNQGAYRAAVIQRNRNRIELQDWTPHPIIRRGAATNTLTVAAAPDGDITLGINGETLAVLNDQTFTSGSLAFFCYAESVPATCRLERLRIWQRTG